MKKIFTLALTLGILSSAFSQPVIKKVSFISPLFSISFGHRYVETYSYTANARDMEIAKINANYQSQVKQIMNLRLGAARKVDLLQQLQKERANKIQNVNNRFFDARNKYNYMHYDRNFRWIK